MKLIQANKKPTLHTHLDKVFFVSPMLSHDLIDKKNKLGFTLISTPLHWYFRSVFGTTI